jgi:hypothetical protein
MDPIILSDIPFEINPDELLVRMRVRPKSDDANDLRALVSDSQKIGRPKALYGVAHKEIQGDNHILVGDVLFTSRVLRVNLEKAERIFPFVCTCGMELQEWGDSINDLIWSFWAEAIKEEFLRAALNALQVHIHSKFNPGHISTMSPGSLEDWPISQQEPMFKLLGRPKEVQLTDSLLMVPTKSVSGFVFPTEANFESCQMCPRKDCPGRRAPYDETLYEREYCPAG